MSEAISDLRCDVQNTFSLQHSSTSSMVFMFSSKETNQGSVMFHRQLPHFSEASRLKISKCLQLTVMVLSFNYCSYTCLQRACFQVRFCTSTAFLALFWILAKCWLWICDTAIVSIATIWCHHHGFVTSLQSPAESKIGLWRHLLKAKFLK